MDLENKRDGSFHEQLPEERELMERNRVLILMCGVYNNNQIEAYLEGVRIARYTLTTVAMTLQQIIHGFSRVRLK